MSFSGVCIGGPAAGRYASSPDPTLRVEDGDKLVIYKHRVLVDFPKSRQQITGWVPNGKTNAEALSEALLVYEQAMSARRRVRA